MESLSEVPSSPDASLLLTKRRCPFGESPREMKVPASDLEHRIPGHDNQGYTAFQILMQHSQQSQPGTATPSYTSCWVCAKQSEIMPCTFCEHGVCEMCVRQCDKCFGVFCSFCATVKYDQHEDRALCLTCNAEEIKKNKMRVASNVGQRRAELSSERFPQATA
ncbi:uncharacterized protein LOC116300942 isoform X2 [Actinia tenebrosa]|uniref:Uncharacterized protein LOC116300942 isoform X2 n=1 Tax=Actinia tenebrosa TaxID=6105 RepID=A0A6P8IGH0_ACTTE|nr:uncharacterized protein LOC116300942 isoform X2 [Actinia tenebrosa]